VACLDISNGDGGGPMIAGIQSLSMLKRDRGARRLLPGGNQRQYLDLRVTGVDCRSHVGGKTQNDDPLRLRHLIEFAIVFRESCAESLCSASCERSSAIVTVDGDVGIDWECTKHMSN
jgi:hypothetical protein